MKKRLLKFTSGIIAGIVVCLSFSCDRFYDVRKSYALENNSAAGKVEQLRSGKKTNFASYKETIMPFDANDYYDETGIWETMLNGDGTLFSYAKKDSIGKYVFISWNNKKQTESEFPSVKKVKQKFINGYPSVVPYNEGTKQGYIFYRKRNNKFLCYQLGEKGKIIREISLQKFLEQELMNNDTENESQNSPYGVRSINQTKKNRITVGITERNTTFGGTKVNCGWEFDINVKKNKLLSVTKCDYIPIGADKNYNYGIKLEENASCYMGGGMYFKNGVLIIKDRKTGKQVTKCSIPNDIISNANESISQCFDIKNGKIWLANRTGVYYLKPGDSEWTMILKPEESSYLNLDYSLTDLTVVNKKRFYLMLLEGEDDETATMLIRYDKK